jgi:hypothetical protein
LDALIGQSSLNGAAALDFRKDASINGFSA